MKLRGIDFGNVLGASGVQGFFGEGYWFHKPLQTLGLFDFTGMTFVSKTATLFSRRGNMSLTRKYTPRDLFPSCILAKPRKGLMLNSVGLSNPGLGTFLGMGVWQAMTAPKMISIMSVETTRKRRMTELRIMTDMIGLSMENCVTPYGIQINLSCPNVEGHEPEDAIDESEEALEIVSILGVPMVPKYSIASAPISAIMELNGNSNCDAICVSNTIPFGWSEIDWKRVWGSDTSPIANLGGGGLSGAVLLPLVCDWIRALRGHGFTKPINGGGGIMCEEDVNYYNTAGASSIFLGTVASLRPWRVQSIIQRANTLNWR